MFISICIASLSSYIVLINLPKNKINAIDINSIIKKTFSFALSINSEAIAASAIKA